MSSKPEQSTPDGSGEDEEDDTQRGLGSAGPAASGGETAASTDPGEDAEQSDAVDETGDTPLDPETEEDDPDAASSDDPNGDGTDNLEIFTEEDASADDRDEDEEEGDLVGAVISDRYRLDEYIGGGGMGEVYRAEHVMMKKTVAVKILRSEVTDREKLVERFRREAQAAGNLDHPYICSATDFGRAEDGSFYLVMEHVEGRNLGDVLARHGALEIDRALQIADQVADALEVAHEKGVVHRDLKPENVMLVDQPDGTESVKVLDFGVSRVQMADNMPSITKTGAVFGTPHYMSPEQAGGEQVDERADLYGLGSVLYEMLTGRPVFEGEKSVHVMASHLKDDPKPPSRKADWADVPPELDRLVLDLLEKDPEDRPQSATDVRGRIEVVRQKLRASSTFAPEDEQTGIAVEAPTGTWLERAGDTTRTFYRVVDDRLPIRLGVDRLSGQTLAVITLLGLAGLLLSGVATLYVGKQLVGSVSETAQSQAERDLLADRRAFQEDPEVAEALEAFRSGSPGRAAAQLEELEEDHASNPHMQFLLGQTHAAAGDWKAALDHYERAIRNRGEYTSDPALLGDVLFALGSSDESVRRAAEAILQMSIDRPEVRERVARAAWHAESREKRQRAYDLLKSAEVFGSLPDWTRHAIELRRANGCEAHRRHIEGLAEAGAPQGLDVLRLYDRMPRSGCGAFNNEDCYGCVRKDIAEAIETLESAGSGR